MTLTLIVLAGMMGASGIVLAAAAAHAAPGAGLDSAAYMLLLHATAVLSGVALLQLGLLLRPLMFVILAAWVLGSALFSGDIALRAFTGHRTLAAPTGGNPYSRLARTRSRCGRGLGSELSLRVPCWRTSFGDMGGRDCGTGKCSYIERQGRLSDDSATPTRLTNALI